MASAHRPFVIGSVNGAETCATCGARPYSVCNAFDTDNLDRLAAAAVRGRAEPGQTFFAEGDPADSFFNVTAGTVRLFKSLPDGRRQIIGFASRGHFLGLAVANSFAFTAEAVEPVTYCRFSRTRLRGLLDDFPALERRLLEIATNELVAAQVQMLLLGRKTARERVASFLLSRAKDHSPCEGPLARIHLPMTRSDIADYLGLTIETVSRTMTKLKEEGVIAIPQPSEILIKSRAALESQAGESSVTALFDNGQSRTGETRLKSAQQRRN